jgi:hypothetical protein
MLSLIFVASILPTKAIKSEPPLLRCLLAVNEMGWPDKGVIAIPYKTPAGISFQMSRRDNHVKKLSDVHEKDVMLRMHFDTRSRLVASEQSGSWKRTREADLTKAAVNSIFRRLFQMKWMADWSTELQVFITSNSKDYLLSIGSLKRTVGSAGVIVISKDFKTVRTIAGY